MKDLKSKMPKTTPGTTLETTSKTTTTIHVSKENLPKSVLALPPNFTVDEVNTAIGTIPVSLFVDLTVIVGEIPIFIEKPFEDLEEIKPSDLLKVPKITNLDKMAEAIIAVCTFDSVLIPILDETTLDLPTLISTNQPDLIYIKPIVVGDVAKEKIKDLPFDVFEISVINDMKERYIFEKMNKQIFA